MVLEFSQILQINIFPLRINVVTEYFVIDYQVAYQSRVSKKTQGQFLKGFLLLSNSMCFIFCTLTFLFRSYGFRRSKNEPTLKLWQKQKLSHQQKLDWKQKETITATTHMQQKFQKFYRSVHLKVFSLKSSQSILVTLSQRKIRLFIMVTKHNVLKWPEVNQEY